MKSFIANIFSCTLLALMALFAVGMMSTTVWGQTTTASWGFEGVTTTNTGTDALISVGSATADAGALTTGSAFSAHHTSASTVWSNPAGNGSTKSVSSNNWGVGDYFKFLFNTTGYGNIKITWDQTGSSTGPRDFKVQYSTNGSSWTDASGTNSTYSLIVSNWTSSTTHSEHTRTLDLTGIAGLENQTTVYIRLVDNSTTSIGGATVASGGTGRVDNFIVTGGTISAPTATTNPATSISTTGATLNGTVNPNNGVTTETFNYGVTNSYGSTAPASQGSLTGGSAQAVSAVISSLTPNQLYHFQDPATNSQGSTSGSDATFTTLPSAPTTTAATSVMATSFTANWTDGDANAPSSYELDVATDAGFTSLVPGYNPLIGITGTTQTVAGLTAGVTYHYRVRAVGTGGTSSNSNTTDVTTTLSIPDPPVATAATSVATTSFTANWNSSANASSYRLDVATDAGFTSYVSGYQDLTVGGTSQSVTGLTPNTAYHYRVRAVNAGGTSTNSNTIDITTSCPTITVAPASLPNGQVGVSYTQTVSASGGTGTYAYAVSSGNLPTNLSLNPASGLISGMPSANGVFNFSITATDSFGCTGVKAYSVTVSSCPVFTITPASLPNGSTGQVVAETLVTTGGTAPYTYALFSGTLPNGITLSSDGIGMGTLTGTGTFTFTIQVTDSNGCTGTKTYTVATCGTITLSSLTGGTVGTAVHDTVTSSGGTNPYTYAVTVDLLPAGLTLHASTGIITGTPTKAGTFNFTITSTDSNGCTGNQAYSLTFTCPTITVPTATMTGNSGVHYSSTFPATGGAGPYTYTISAGTVPTGLTLGGDSLTGTPITNGQFIFTVIATDADSCIGSVNDTLTISCPVITPGAPAPTGTVGALYNSVLTTSGGIAPYTHSLSTPLPTGVSLVGGDTLRGTPTASGTFAFRDTVRDANGCTGIRNDTIAINCPTITITPASLPSGSISVAYNQQLSSSGGTAGYSYALTSGTLPSPVTLSPGGLISGTPASGGSFPITVTVTDTFGCTGTKSYTLIISSSIVTSIANGAWSSGSTWDQGSKPTANQSAIVKHQVTLTTSDTCQSLEVDSGGVFSMKKFTLGLAGTYTIKAGGQGRQSLFNAIPGNGATPQSFATTSIYTFDSASTGFSNTNVTFGNLHWYANANATPSVGTVINGDLVKDSSAAGNQLRCGTGSTTSRIVVVHGNVILNTGIIVASNSVAPITGGLDVDGNISIASGATLEGNNATTGTGTVYVGGNLMNNGTIAVGTGTGNFILSFKGTGASNFDPGVTNAFRTVGIAAGRTVNLINHNVTVNATYTVTDSGTLNFGTNVITGAGGFSVVPGGTLGIGSTSGITATSASGNMQVTGTRSYDPGANYLYNGSASQVTGDGLPSVVNNLTINNSTGVGLSGNTSVGGVLTFTSGNVYTGADTLGVSSTGSVNRTIGYVVGNFKKNVASGSNVSRTFEIGDSTNYTPLSVTFTTVTGAGDLTGSTKPTEHPQVATSGLNQNKDVNRYYTLSNNGIVFDNYSTTLNFVTGDKDAGSNDASYVVAKYDSPNWSYPSVGTRTTTSIQATGMTSFSDFAVGESGSWTITATSDTNGSINPSGSFLAPIGSNQVFTMTPHTGYHIDSITVDGVYVGNTSPDTIKNVSANHTIFVKFAVNTYTIVSSVNGGNGTISPLGLTIVTYGGSQIYTLTPNTGYHIDSISVDSSFIGNTSPDTIKNVTANHTISVKFAINTYTVTANVVGSGAVNKLPNQTSYAYGSSVQLTATPFDYTWQFTGWSGDTTSTANPITLGMYSAKTVTATFVKDSAYLASYRSFTLDSITHASDNKGKLGKFVVAKPTFAEFTLGLRNDSANVTGLHVEFGSSVDTNGFVFSITPAATKSSTDGKFKKWDYVFSSSLHPGDSVFVHGWGISAKGQAVSKYYWTRNNAELGKKALKTTNIANALRLPMPNEINGLVSTFNDGGFNANNSLAGNPGILIGLPRVDSVKAYGWLFAPNYTDVLKTLYDKSGPQNGAATNFDFYLTNHKPILKGQKTLPPTKFNDKLLGDLIVLKLNVAASALSMPVIPSGFGELVYNDSTSNPLNGLMVRQIDSLADTMMSARSYTAMFPSKTFFENTYGYRNVDSTIARINAAFEGKLDTVSFTTNVQFKGMRPLSSVPFLRKKPANVIPATIVASPYVIPQVPMGYALYQNYPNPFNPTTRIQFDLPEDAIVTLKIYNVLGQEVKSLFENNPMSQGIQTVQFNAQNLATGVYFYRIIAESVDENGATAVTFQTVKKMMLIK